MNTLVTAVVTSVSNNTAATAAIIAKLTAADAAGLPAGSVVLTAADQQALTDAAKQIDANTAALTNAS